MPHPPRSLLQELHRGFGAVVGAELLEDVADVLVDGVDADAEAVGNLFVGMALAEQGQDLVFALSGSLMISRIRIPKP